MYLIGRSVALADENSCVIVISDFDGGSHLQRV